MIFSNENKIRCLNDPDFLINSFYNNVKYCMAQSTASCSGSIINAHTISKKYLRNICNDEKKLYLTKTSGHNHGFLIGYKLGSISKASCFTGFCAHHDKKLFSSFENQLLKPSHEQIYDISFRALCREYFYKKCNVKFMRLLKTDTFNFMNKTGYLNSKEYQEKLAHSTKEANDQKRLYNAFIKHKKIKKCNRGLGYMVIQTSKLPIASTGVFFPLLNIYSKKIQFEESRQQGFIYNLIPLENNSLFIIAFMMPTYNDIHREFLNPFFEITKKHNEFLDYLLTYIFFNNDNMAINPQWYDNLDSQFKIKLNQLMNIQVGQYSNTIIRETIDFSDHVKGFNCQIVKHHFSN